MINIEGMLKGVPSAKQLYKRELRMAKTFVEKTLIKEGKYSIESGAASGGRNRKSESWDWYFAVGGYSAWGSGKVEVKCDTSGQYTYEMILRYDFRDRYNWDKGKSVSILGITITDAFMAKFHRQGLAREFDMTGTVVETIRWTKGDSKEPEPNPRGFHDGR